jgi:hypothetical protein
MESKCSVDEQHHASLASSIVIRINMSSCSFMGHDPPVVVLDAKSFPVMFDVTKGEKFHQILVTEIREAVTDAGGCGPLAADHCFGLF